MESTIWDLGLKVWEIGRFGIDGQSQALGFGRGLLHATDADFAHAQDFSSHTPSSLLNWVFLNIRVQGGGIAVI